MTTTQTTTQTATLVIDGKTYTATPQVLANYKEREQYILSFKPSPLDVLLTLPPLPPEPKAPVPPEGKLSDANALAFGERMQQHKRELAAWQDQATERKRMQDLAWKDAQKPRLVTFEDEAIFDKSMHGIAWRLWRALREHHPEIDGVQAALSLMERAGNQRLQEIATTLDGSNGETTGETAAA